MAYRLWIPQNAFSFKVIKFHILLLFLSLDEKYFSYFGLYIVGHIGIFNYHMQIVSANAKSVFVNSIEPIYILIIYLDCLFSASCHTTNN